MLYRGTNQRTRNTVEERISFERLWRGAMQALGEGRHHLRPIRSTHHISPDQYLVTSRTIPPPTAATPCCCHCECLFSRAAVAASADYIKSTNETNPQCLNVKLYNVEHNKRLPQRSQALRSVVRLVATTHKI